MDSSKIITAKIIDKVKQYKNNEKNINTLFLDPGEYGDVINILKEVPYIFWGGYEEAERKIIFIGEDIDFSKYINIIHIKCERPLNHRSVLGSVLGLGINRNIIGDILINDNECDIIIIKDISTYIIDNLRKVGRETVEAYKREISELIVPKENKREIKITVSSLRIDVVISSTFGISREISSDLIENKKVKLNFKTITSASKRIKELDLISVMGYGRIEIVGILGETRKSKIRINIKRSK